MADIADYRHLVGDQHDGQAQALVDVAQQFKNGSGGLRVQRRGGLVAQQDLGVMHQRPGNAHALLLPAGQLRRVHVVLFLQADQLQQFAYLALAFGLGHAGHLQGQLDVLPHGLGRHQVEVLEDHADAPAQGHKLVLIERRDIHLVDQYAALAGLLQAVDGAQQR
ncbi:hypothetical protein D3C75_789300 [compost metagenome]